MRKLDHLQILRAAAASLVVLSHASHGGVAASPFALRIASITGYGAFTGIASFFILSGLIMTLQMSGRFGESGVPVLFLWRRIVRIVPMYWIATLLWFGYSLSQGWQTPHFKAQLLLSLAFLPNYLNATHGQTAPILVQGWTLNYEMAFYVFFACALFMKRYRGLAFLILVPAILDGFGSLPRATVTDAPAAIWGFYLGPSILLFARGVLIGFIVTELKPIPKVHLPFSPALLLFVPVLALIALPSLDRVDLSSQLVLWCTLVILLCVITSQEHPGRVMRALILLGDASFSTYLFHLYIFPLLYPVIGWLDLSHHRGLHSLALPMQYLGSIVAANLLGLAIHLTIERPLMRTLRRIPFGNPVPNSAKRAT